MLVSTNKCGRHGANDLRGCREFISRLIVGFECSVPEPASCFYKVDLDSQSFLIRCRFEGKVAHVRDVDAEFKNRAPAAKLALAPALAKSCILFSLPTGHRYPTKARVCT
jgi:hypothetical protein